MGSKSVNHHEIQDTDKGMDKELLEAGAAVIQFEKPSEQIVVDSHGDYQSAKTPGWIKFSTEFRKHMLKELKGAKLSVFMCVCLHLNEEGESFPSIETIVTETGYDRDTVMEAIAAIEQIGNGSLMKVVREKGKKNRYFPYFAAYGRRRNPVVPEPEPVGKIRPVGKTPTSRKNPAPPVGKNSTTFAQTSRTFPDSKKRREIKKIPVPLSIENQIALGLPSVVESDVERVEKVKRAIHDHFKLNVKWDTPRTRNQSFVPSDFLEYARTSGITPEQVRQAADIWGSDKNFNWTHPTLKLIWEKWQLLMDAAARQSAPTEVYWNQPI